MTTTVTTDPSRSAEPASPDQPAADSITPGQQIRFPIGPDNRWWWDVRAAQGRFVIATHQARFEPQGEMVHTILDTEHHLRGSVNTVGNGWPLDDEGIAELMAGLLSGEWEISRRNQVPCKVWQTRETAGTSASTGEPHRVRADG